MTESVEAPEGDAEWSALLAGVTGEEPRFFTDNQLYLAYARNKVQVTRYVSQRGRFGLVLIVIGLATWIYALKVDWGITLVLGIAGTLCGVAMVGTGVVTKREPAPREPVERWISEATGELGHRLSEPTLGDAGLELAPESARCLIIVQRDLLADLLLKNGAGRELAALIVAESGYPDALAREARRVLTERPDTKVIALHDATPEGVAMLARLLKSRLFPLDQRTLVDAGLFPADVTWLAELAPAIPAGHTHRVPVDSLSYDAIMTGLRGVLSGALSIHAAIDAAREPRG